MEQIKYISIYQIQDPVIDMRTDLDPANLQDLADSIKANGLLQAIVVRPVGDHYEVIAGHRRLAACRLLRLPEIACMVRDADDSETAILRMHENIVREDVDVVSEALFIARTCTQLKWDAKKFAEEIKRSVQYVEDRLAIATMPDYMQAHLKDGSLKLGVALALNQIEDERVKYDWTMSAMRDGMTVRGAQDSLRIWQRDYAPDPNRPAELQPQEAPQAPPVILWPCEACGKHTPTNELKFVRVHANPTICVPE